MTADHAAILAACKRAQATCNGGSSDDEVDALREALELALDALNLTMPPVPEVD